MSQSFQEALNAFVADELKRTSYLRDEVAKAESFEVVSVEFDYDDGYAYSSYTYEDPSFSVNVTFMLNGNKRFINLFRNDEAYTVGTFLTSLLDHQDAQ